jgi:hypothetical protein
VPLVPFERYIDVKRELRALLHDTISQDNKVLAMMRASPCGLVAHLLEPPPVGHLR